MGGVDALVVGEHVDLVVPHDLDEIFQAGVPLGGGIGQVGCGIDDRRDEHEAQHGEQQGLDQPGGEPGSVLFLGPVPPLEVQPDEVEQGQAHRAVDHRPLAGRADAPHEAGQEQGQCPLAEGGAGGQGQVPVHEVVHGQDEEHAVGVDGGDAGLGQVHEVKGKEGGAAEGHNRLAEEVFQEHIEQGDHQHAEEGTHEPPAEGGQAEHADAQADDQLAQGRVGDLVGVDAPDVLVGGAGVVDLIEIGGVVPGGHGGHSLPLVEQGRGPLAGVGDVAEGDASPVGVVQGQLPQLQPRVAAVRIAGEAEHPHLQGQGVGALAGAEQVVVDPLEQVGVLLMEGGGGVGGVQSGGQGGAVPVLAPDKAGDVVGLVLIGEQGVPGLAVRAGLQGVAAGVEAGVVHHPGDGRGLGQGEGDGLPGGELAEGLGIGEGAQIPEGGEGVHRRQQQQRQRVLAPHGEPAAGEGQGAGGGAGHGHPLQGAFPGGHGVAVVAQQTEHGRQDHDGKHQRGGDILHEVHRGRPPETE